MDTDSEAVVERSFSVGPRPELSVNNVSGRIGVRVGDAATIEVRAFKRGSPGAIANTRIDLTQSGNRVRARTQSERSGLLNLVRSVASVEYDVLVPRDCEVHLEGVSTEIEVSGISGTVRIQTVSGDVRVQECSGECHITTVSGDVQTRQVSGVATVRTTSGDAVVSDSQLQHFNLNSVSGDFTIETPLVNGQHYLAKTVSGDLLLKLPEGSGATVQMKTVSGDVTSDLPAEVIRAGRRHWQGRINGGGATLEMNSVSGDMRIARSGAPAPATRAPERPVAATVAPDPPRPPDPPYPPSPPEPPYVPTGVAVDGNGGTAEGNIVAGDDTNAVLKALEQGEISVEEAMERLDRLR